MSTGLDGNSGTDVSECPAEEVLQLRSRKLAGYFASSLEPRNERTNQIKFRIGQVVQHHKHGYRGVIVGWDRESSAPDYWREKMYKKHQEWATQPNYLILVDTRDRRDPQLTYVPQENLKVMRHTRVIHPKLEAYFDYYDGAQYIPRLWLQTIYPQD